MRRHHSDTVGYVVAQRGNCLTIRDDEKRLVYGRSFHPLEITDLPHKRPASWFLGVLLCPGDTTEAAAEWAHTIDARDLDRIHFYHVPGVALEESLDAWRKAGLREPRAYEVRDFRSFHHLYGRHHGDRVYVDHA